MTEFIPSDSSIWWNSSKAAALLSGYHILFATASTHEAYLFSVNCKTDGMLTLHGSATTEKEAFDLITESSGKKLICLLSDDIAPDCGASIALKTREKNHDSQNILIVNDAEKVYSLPKKENIFHALCSSGSIGRGGLYHCLESVLILDTYYVDPSLKQSFAEIEQKGVETLNSRERQIIGLVAQGLTNKEIAMQIYIAERTVRDYISSILLKLAVANRAGAAAWAMRHGLVLS
jgi:DNA-binding NarL/FixJ family response regulator